MMALKEQYEKMNDDEVLERFERLSDYFEYAREIIIDEVIKRKLKTEEETKRKIKDVEVFEHAIKNNGNKNNVVTPNKNAYSNTGNYMTRGLIIFLIGGLGLITGTFFDFIVGVKTLFWTEADAKIITAEKIVDGYTEKGEVSYTYNSAYEYSVLGKKYISTKLNYTKREDISSMKNFFYHYNNYGINIKIRYNPSDPEKSVVYPYSVKMELFFLVFGIILVKIFLWSVKKASEEFGDFDIVKSKKDIIKLIVIVEIVILIILISIET